MSTGRAAVVTGIGSYVPPNIVTNEDLSQRLDTSDEWIRTRTGIAERFYITPGTSTGDLAVEAGLRALKSAGDEQVGAVVLATTTPDQPCPATAPRWPRGSGSARCPPSTWRPSAPDSCTASRPPPG